MSWLSLLKDVEAAPAAVPTKPTKAPCVGFVGPPPPAFQILESRNEGLLTKFLAPANQATTVEFAPMSTTERDAIRKWLRFIGEVDENIIASVVMDCERDGNVRLWFIGQAPAFERSESTDAYAARQALLINRGLSVDEARAMANLLALRDDGRDERRACVECTHLSGMRSARKCRNWRSIGLHGPSIPAESSSTLGRCKGYISAMKAESANTQEIP